MILVHCIFIEHCKIRMNINMHQAREGSLLVLLLAND